MNKLGDILSDKTGLIILSLACWLAWSLIFKLISYVVIALSKL